MLKKRVLSLLLVFVMVLGMLPVNAFAMAPQPEWAEFNETPAKR